MHWRAFHCGALSAALLVSARAADPGSAGSVMVESNLARKTERAVQGDRIWSEVILATNSGAPKPSPPELVGAEPMLRRVFGYNQFVVIGRSTEPLDEGEHWLTLGKKFSMSVNGHHATGDDELKDFRGGGYVLSLHIFQEKQTLLKTEARLAPGIPLWFRGPECGKGLIIFVIKVAEPKR